LKLPVKEILKGLPTSTFYCPGSILRVRWKQGVPLTAGMPEEGSVYFDRSLAFEVERDGPATALAWYAPNDVLQSGWLLGAGKIQEKAATVAVSVGKGQVTLFGFPPQHRGQTHGTFRPFFNALLRGGM
jgi:hypothetical protein